MRWDGLFADLEAQAQALALAERAAEVETRTRDEIGQLAVYDRLRAAVDTELQLAFAGGLAVRGTLTRVGVDWLLLDSGQGREVVGVNAALQRVRGLGRASGVPGSAGVVESRLGLGHVLRGLARDRSPLRLHLIGDGASSVDATIDRVGADFVEVATHPAGEVRRRGDVRDVELVPLAALAALSRRA
ncbi:hypothetical protein [uncultured Jatrophihabitans sp.]|uniref:hypothetical protein n=1 Tax=uncultured Jatrophihabitans sp. TaxID=1610747 RepID=UPI0035CAF17E